MRRILFLVLVLASAGIVAAQETLTRTQAGANAGITYEKKGEFRLVLPPGWRKSREDRKAHATIFQGPSGLSLWVSQGHHAMSPQDFADHMANLLSQIPGFMMIGSEQVTFAGLPALKRQYVMPQGKTPPIRNYSFLTLTNDEYWIVRVYSEEKDWPAADSPEWKDVEMMLASFQFLEPTYSRLKAK
jgi:hypothetical protein